LAAVKQSRSAPVSSTAVLSVQTLAIYGNPFDGFVVLGLGLSIRRVARLVDGEQAFQGKRR
jgi:hypothetical protein